MSLEVGSQPSGTLENVIVNSLDDSVTLRNHFVTVIQYAYEQTDANKDSHLRYN